MKLFRLIPQLLWLLAWAAWLCCGVGFYHQLPRDWGRAVRTMGMESGEHAIGFLHGRHVVVTQNDRDDGTTRLRCRDAHTGMGLRENVELTSPSNIDYVPPSFSMRHGVVIGTKVDGGQVKRILDFWSGEWKDLGPANLKVHAFHPTEPRVIVGTPSDLAMPPKLAVVNLETLDRIFEWTGDSSKEGQFDSIRACYFDPESRDVIAVRERVQGDWEKIVGQALLRLPLNQSTPPPPIKLERSYGYVSAPAKNGLMLFHGANEQSGRWDVIDPATGAVVFSNDGRTEPPKKYIRAGNKHQPVPMLSTEGNAVLTPSQVLWDVRSKRILWQPEPKYEDEISRAQAADFLATEFPIREDWPQFFRNTKPPAMLRFLEQRTTAVHNMETGGVRLRLWWDHDSPQHFSSDGSLVHHNHSCVYRFPPPANWLWIVICQAVLALPLVLLWLFLRWRRRRRLRASGGR